MVKNGLNPGVHLIFPNFCQSSGAEEEVGQAGLLFKTRPPRTSWAWPLWRFIADGWSTLKWLAWLRRGEGGCEDRLRAVTASGYPRGGEGGGGGELIP